MARYAKPLDRECGGGKMILCRSQLNAPTRSIAARNLYSLEFGYKFGRIPAETRTKTSRMHACCTEKKYLLNTTKNFFKRISYSLHAFRFCDY